VSDFQRFRFPLGVPVSPLFVVSQLVKELLLPESECKDTYITHKSKRYRFLFNVYKLLFNKKAYIFRIFDTKVKDNYMILLSK